MILVVVVIFFGMVVVERVGIIVVGKDVVFLVIIGIVEVGIIVVGIGMVVESKEIKLF
jgi:hypothetical protein